MATGPPSRRGRLACQAPAIGCPAIPTELAEFDALLGPDADVAPTEDSAAGFAGAVMAGAAALPFRGVVRRLTRAHRRDRVIAAAVVGGLVRRGFLRRQSMALTCASAAS